MTSTGQTTTVYMHSTIEITAWNLHWQWRHIQTKLKTSVATLSANHLVGDLSQRLEQFQRTVVVLWRMVLYSWVATTSTVLTSIGHRPTCSALSTVVSQESTDDLECQETALRQDACMKQNQVSHSFIIKRLRTGSEYKIALWRLRRNMTINFHNTLWLYPTGINCSVCKCLPRTNSFRREDNKERL